MGVKDSKHCHATVFLKLMEVMKEDSPAGEYARLTWKALGKSNTDAIIEAAKQERQEQKKRQEINRAKNIEFKKKYMNKKGKK